ncbi:uncharacterized protein MONOS_18685 [Monocercomonoides exilis]|uniref:uncharacterized protein n=1 Tax=Monocercomonoides exilis TaxID=2049356 RepID=UPI00355A81FE|nr:hypothetical protein MONOS_18685 [Monocercomonoides exilis]
MSNSKVPDFSKLTTLERQDERFSNLHNDNDEECTRCDLRSHAEQERKSDRTFFLSKRRKDFNEPTKLLEVQEIEMNLKLMLQQLETARKEDQYQVLQKLRYLTCTKKFDEALKEAMLLVQIMSHVVLYLSDVENPKMQFESSLILINLINKCDQEQLISFLYSECIEKLAEMCLRSPYIEIVENGIWALGNYAQDGECCHRIGQTRILDLVEAIINNYFFEHSPSNSSPFIASNSLHPLSQQPSFPSSSSLSFQQVFNSDGSQMNIQAPKLTLNSTNAFEAKIALMNCVMFFLRNMFYFIKQSEVDSSSSTASTSSQWEPPQQHSPFSAASSTMSISSIASSSSSASCSPQMQHLTFSAIKTRFFRYLPCFCSYAMEDGSKSFIDIVVILGHLMRDSDNATLNLVQNSGFLHKLFLVASFINEPLPLSNCLSIFNEYALATNDEFPQMLIKGGALVVALHALNYYVTNLSIEAILLLNNLTAGRAEDAQYVAENDDILAKLCEHCTSTKWLCDPRIIRNSALVLTNLINQKVFFDHLINYHVVSALCCAIPWAETSTVRRFLVGIRRMLFIGKQNALYLLEKEKTEEMEQMKEEKMEKEEGSEEDLTKTKGMDECEDKEEDDDDKTLLGDDNSFNCFTEEEICEYNFCLLELLNEKGIKLIEDLQHSSDPVIAGEARTIKEAYLDKVEGLIIRNMDNDDEDYDESEGSELEADTHEDPFDAFNT